MLYDDLNWKEIQRRGDICKHRADSLSVHQKLKHCKPTIHHKQLKKKKTKPIDYRELLGICLVVGEIEKGGV